MRRYYFDLRDGDAIAPDDEGMELPNMRAAQEEAAQALGDMAKDAARGIGDSGSARQMAIEVRDDNGLVLEAKFVLEIDRYRK